jgi:hypothetical protein
MFTSSKPKIILLILIMLRHTTNVNQHISFETRGEIHLTSCNNRFEAGCDSGGPLRPFLELPIHAVPTIHVVA